MKTIVTHNGGFHADDVFGCALLSIVFKDEEIKIIRTRDEEIIKSGDIVLDIGRINDENLNRFDHHQKGGGGLRENGIPYASFGLIWKKFGESLCGKESAERIDKSLVQTVDAIDNGVDLCEKPKVKIFSVASVIGAFNPSEGEGADYDKVFFEVMEFAKKLLTKLIDEEKDYQRSVEILKEAHDLSDDKRMVVVTEMIRKDAIGTIPDLIYVVCPYHNNKWSIRAVRKNDESFESKKPFPLEWAGQGEGGNLDKITGVSDAIFCHNNRFIASANSKEGAISLAKLALDHK